VNILVADDAVFMRMRLRKLLEQAGHSVREAANGREAVQMYQATRPDIVLMDITMPEIDGVSATRTICQEDPSARVIMVSALGQQAMIIAAIQAGARDFVLKPFEPERLLRAISQSAIVAN